MSRKLWLLVFVSLIITTGIVNAGTTNVSGFIIGMTSSTTQGIILTVKNSGACNDTYRVTGTTPVQLAIVDTARANYFGPNKPVMIVYSGDQKGWFCEILSMTICNKIVDSDGHCQ